MRKTVKPRSSIRPWTSESRFSPSDFGGSFVYDLLVLGDDLASHVAAAYASRNGLKTLLVAPDGLGGVQLIGDFVFHLDPAPMTGLGPGQPGFSVLAELGVEIPESHPTSMNPAYQVLLPCHRIDFFNDPDSLFAELAREFPEREADIRDFYGTAREASLVFQDWIAEHPRIQPQTLKEYFSYLKIFPFVLQYKFAAARFDRLLSQDAALEKVWEAQQALLSLNTDDLFSFPSAFQYSAPLRGIAGFPQGKQFLFNEMIRLLESCGGLYLSRHTVTSIARGKTITLEMKTPDGLASQATGRYLILSTKSDALPLLNAKRGHSPFWQRFRPAAIAGYPFTLFLGVREKFLPEPMARHIAVVADVQKDLYDRNLILLETGMPEKDKPLSQAKNCITATVYLPAEDSVWTPGALSEDAESILVRLEEFFPFLKEGIELYDLDKSIELSLSGRKVLSPKYKVRNALFTSFSAASDRTKWNNIFLTGASLLADFGFEAEILSGKNAALRILQKGK